MCVCMLQGEMQQPQKDARLSITPPSTPLVSAQPVVRGSASAADVSSAAERVKLRTRKTRAA